MKNYFFVFILMVLSGCMTTPTTPLVVSEICVKDSMQNKLHTYSLVEFHASRNDKENYNRLLLPTNNPQPILLGTTVDNSYVYSAVFGYTDSLKYAYVDYMNYHFSFKRNFDTYKEQWTQWETSDLSETIDNSYYLHKLKVRFKTMSYDNYRVYVKSLNNKPVAQNLNNCE